MTAIHSPFRFELSEKSDGWYAMVWNGGNGSYDTTEKLNADPDPNFGLFSSEEAAREWAQQRLNFDLSNARAFVLALILRGEQRRDGPLVSEAERFGSHSTRPAIMSGRP